MSKLVERNNEDDLRELEDRANEIIFSYHEKYRYNTHDVIRAMAEKLAAIEIADSRKSREW